MRAALYLVLVPLYRLPFDQDSPKERDWIRFKKTVPWTWICLPSSHARYRIFLNERYASLGSMNRARGTSHTKLGEIRLAWAPPEHPVRRADWDNFVDKVWPEALLKGDGTLSTPHRLWTQYLEERYEGDLGRLNKAHHWEYGAFAILLFCLATMSFPAEVAMIPNFILLKELSMLNTFWALLLPAAANGFFIFLMKGFFDSLPNELFEAAAIDGGGPLRAFWQVALPLCKPVMAVIALQAFVASYGSFMWAYIVCQDADLWTLMVYIHQFQIGNPVHLVMAALTLASVPTLVVFVLCQKIILRGIVVPTMK